MPNIGYEVGGATPRSINLVMRGLTVTMPEAGAAGVTISAYIEDIGTGDGFRAAVVNASDFQTVLASSAIRTDISTLGWYTFSGGSLATFTPANATDYLIVVGSNSATDAQIYYDDPGTTAHVGGGAPITVFDPLTLDVGGADTARDFSIYMTYTAASGGAGGIVFNLQIG